MDADFGIPGPDEPPMDLQAAITRAIEESRPYAVRLGDVIDKLAGDLERMPGPDPASGNSDLRELAKLDRVLVAAIVDELRAMRQVLLRSVDHFNIVFFGRTMAGKSTAIEALTGGDGRSISDGQCDNTIEVQVVDWGSCHLHDTPGIDGWGRSVDRETLEERAETAVSEADLVVLCFDNFGQQDTEFAKVASWVATYGKPSVALFNVKNGLWRAPGRVSDREVRVRLSEPVAEHTGHIAASLVDVGLSDTPIVAVHTHRAFAARVTDDYAGQNAVAIHRHRADHGPTRLWEWSNFGVFVGLIETALATDAVGLRLGRIFRQATGALDRADGIFYHQIEEQANAAADPIEAGLRRILALLGEPPADDLRLADLPWVRTLLGKPPAKDRRLADLRRHLAELRQVHHRPIDAPARGTARRHAENVIVTATAALRADAQRRADAAVDAAIAEGITLTGDELAARVFDNTVANRKSGEVLSTLSTYLDNALGAVVADIRAEVKFAAPAARTVDGQAGRSLRKAGIGIGFGGLAAGGIAVLIGLSPIGWTIGTGVLIAAGVTMIGKLLGGFLRGKAAERAAEAKSAARRNAREMVDTAIGDLENALRAQFAEMIAQSLEGVAEPAAARAVELRRAAAAVKARRGVIQARSREIEKTARTRQTRDAAEQRAVDWCATDILQAAVVRLEKSTGSTGDDLWLGESWIDDPHGLGAVTAPTVRPARRRPRVDLRQKLGSIIDSMTALPRPGNGAAWLEQVYDSLGQEPGFRSYLDELTKLATDERPRIVLCGDYDTGKSSFIRRLLVEAGDLVPPSLVVRGDPTTATMTEYKCGALTLVDTPGFHSGIEEHTEIARAAVADAAGVLYLFSGNLVRADRTDLSAVLVGDTVLGLPPKANRALFVINRADELCPDPAADPEGYAALCLRKRQELHAALTVRDAGGRAPSVALDHIFCVAADPFQAGGKARGLRPASYDPFRDWDGVDDLRDALAGISARMRSNHRDASLLGGGIYRLARWRSELSAEQAGMEERMRQLDALAAEMQRQEQIGGAIATERRAVLERQLSDFAMRLVVEAFDAPDGGQERLAGRLENLAIDEELIELVKRWRRDGAEETLQWCRAAEKDLNLLVDRPSYDAAFAGEFESPDTDVLRRGTRRSTRDIVRGAAGFLGKVAEKASAAKTAANVAARASNVARFSTVLQAATMAWDVYELVRESREAKRRADEEIKLRKEVDAAALELAQAYAAEDIVLAEVGAVLRALVAAHGELSSRADDEQKPRDAIHERIARCDRATAEARRLLGTEADTKGDES